MQALLRTKTIPALKYDPAHHPHKTSPSKLSLLRRQMDCKIPSPANKQHLQRNTKPKVSEPGTIGFAGLVVKVVQSSINIGRKQEYEKQDEKNTRSLPGWWAKKEKAGNDFEYAGNDDQCLAGRNEGWNHGLHTFGKGKMSDGCETKHKAERSITR